jgi:hypothetical protein
MGRRQECFCGEPSLLCENMPGKYCRGPVPIGPVGKIAGCFQCFDIVAVTIIVRKTYLSD